MILFLKACVKKVELCGKMLNKNLFLVGKAMLSQIQNLFCLLKMVSDLSNCLDLVHLLSQNSFKDLKAFFLGKKGLFWCSAFTLLHKKGEKSSIKKFEKFKSSEFDLGPYAY